MNIIFICGNNRKNGNTDQILSLLEKSLKELQGGGQPLEIEQIRLGERRIETCRGCRACFERGEQHCPHKDDVQGIAAKMLAADLLVFASPVYVDDVSGLMKNWIDRLAYFCHRPAFAGKPAFVIATSGSSPTGHTVKTLQGALLTWGFHLGGSAGFIMGARMAKAEVEKRFTLKIGKIAARLLREVRVAPVRPPSLIELVVFKIQQHAWKQAEKDTLDYQYWHAQGWFEPDCAYFIPRRVSLPARALANLAASFASLFIS